MVSNIKTARERTASTSAAPTSQEQGPEEVLSLNLPCGNWLLMTSDTGLFASLQMVRDKDKAERKRKAEMARLRREKIMAQMSEMQKHFINENKELFQQSLEDLEASTSAAAGSR